MSDTITPGTQGYIRTGSTNDITGFYVGPVTVEHESCGLIHVTYSDPDGRIRDFYTGSRQRVAWNTDTLILEGERGYDRAAAWVKWRKQCTQTARLVRAWTFDETDPGKALVASEALRALASNPEPPKD